MNLRYGYCKEYSTPLKTEVDYALIDEIARAGYDYVEMRAMLVSSLDEGEYRKLRIYLRDAGLGCDCCCALFPASVRITTADADRAMIAAYTEKTFERCSALGAKKIVFGSAPARALDDQTTEEQGFARMADVLSGTIVPLAEKYDVTVVIEPLRAVACNFIHTLAEGARVVSDVSSERVRLLADTIHMQSNEDDPDAILTYAPILRHVHISELSRVLPEDGYSPYVARVLRNLRMIGYEGTISFETNRGKTPDSMAKALRLLKTELK